MEEIWKDIKGYEGLYKISNYGRVKSLNYNRTGSSKIMKQNITGKSYKHGRGYCCVQLFKNGIKAEYKVHRLVLEAFIGKSKLTVNHINNITTDNRLCNLEYMTNSENIIYSQSKSVTQLTVDGKLVKKWRCINEAARETKTAHIWDCCNGRRKTAGGYRWEYTE